MVKIGTTPGQKMSVSYKYKRDRTCLITYSQLSTTCSVQRTTGWVFIYVAYAIDFPLTLANNVTGIDEFGWCRYAFPILSSVLFLDDYVVRVLRIDPHILAHVLMMVFVCTAINGIEKAYQLEKKG